MEIREPKTSEEIDRYYELRWRVLRQPLGMPRGSEKDELESVSTHMIAVDKGHVVGVGRMHFNSRREAQVRYMAVDDSWKGKGAGKGILDVLEGVAAKGGAEKIVLNSRHNATSFYRKCGYHNVGKMFEYIGIAHQKMFKTLI